MNLSIFFILEALFYEYNCEYPVVFYAVMISTILSSAA